MPPSPYPSFWGKTFLLSCTPGRWRGISGRAVDSLLGRFSHWSSWAEGRRRGSELLRSPSWASPRGSSPLGAWQPSFPPLKQLCAAEAHLAACTTHLLVAGTWRGIQPRQGGPGQPVEARPAPPALGCLGCRNHWALPLPDPGGGLLSRLSRVTELTSPSPDQFPFLREGPGCRHRVRACSWVGLRCWLCC